MQSLHQLGGWRETRCQYGLGEHPLLYSQLDMSLYSDQGNKSLFYKGIDLFHQGSAFSYHPLEHWGLTIKTVGWTYTFRSSQPFSHTHPWILSGCFACWRWEGKSYPYCSIMMWLEVVLFSYEEMYRGSIFPKVTQLVSISKDQDANSLLNRLIFSVTSRYLRKCKENQLQLKWRSLQTSK